MPIPTLMDCLLKNFCAKPLLLLGFAFMPLISAASAATSPRTISFDRDWKFLRDDAPGAESPSFDDSTWRTLDVPHDWQIEDLPPKSDRVPELDAVTGSWRFHPGDNLDWKAPALVDSDWEQISLPDTWEHHSNYTGDNVYGWFRRTLEIPTDCRERDFDLLLGKIDDVDEVWLNGERIGGTGTFPPNYNTAYNADRRYHVPASLIRGDGTDVIAVRVFDGAGNGGIVSASAPSHRIGPFDTELSPSHHFTGHTVGGIGWYRKHFTLGSSQRQISVLFDGVYMNAEVWVNGHLLGEHPHGYTSFEFDLTPWLNAPGQPNVLAVKVRNEGRNSRWYSGSGIYRHVWLTQRGAVHVPTWGLFVTTPEVSREKARVSISTEVSNSTDAAVSALVRAHVTDASGRKQGVSETKLQIAAGETLPAVSSLTVSRPGLWSPDSPSLYSATVEIVIAGQVTDTVSTSFGIRKIEADSVHGFLLNGEPLLLKGGCVHHDNGPLGSAAIDRAEERKIELLKANGFNAVRTSHNPPSPAFLEACDRLGLLVIDEAFDQWTRSKENNAQDYHRFFLEWSDRDIAAMVRRDRNHPSVIMWSIGNEIPEQFQAEATALRLRKDVLSHDTTRFITQAICSDWGKVSQNWDTLSDPAFTALDIPGYNYLPDRYEGDHIRHPDRVMYGSESYPKDTYDYWTAVEQHPYVIGDFVWTAMDYLGEAGIGHEVLSNEANPFFMPWPYYNAWCGDLDLCGFKKPQSYYRDVVWRRSPLEMLVHTPIPAGLTEIISGWGWPSQQKSWTWPGHEGESLQVSVYSRCDTIRLELNGEVIGEKTVSGDTKLTATFDVPYAPGELRAIALTHGKVVSQTTLNTTGAPAKLRLTADRAKIRADRNDLSYVAVEVVDAHGQRVPYAKVPVHFTVSGAGELAAQASGVPNEPASFRTPERETFQGRCLAILRPQGNHAGTIMLRAEAAGLEPATITVEAR